MSVRDATEDDAAACAAIYAPYVTDTAITFEYEPPSADEMARRIAAAQRAHAWLVLEDDGPEEGGGVVGYAYAVPFKERAAYLWSAEVSVSAVFPLPARTIASMGSWKRIRRST